MNDKRNLTPTLLRIGSVIAGLLIWHYVANVVINDASILVSPLIVVSKAYEMLVTTGELYPHLFASSQIFFWGFVLAIHMKVLKSKRDAAEQDYKFLIEEFQPFTRSGAVSKVAWDKTMELRAKEGHYKGKKIPAMSDFVDSSLIEEAQRLAGVKP